MFNPLNNDDGNRKSLSSEDNLSEYLAKIKPAKDDRTELLYLILEQKCLDEKDEKLLFNIVLNVDIVSFDFTRSKQVLEKSRKTYFLIVEKLIDSEKLLLATKMLNMAGSAGVFVNKYFYLKKRLKACRSRYINHTKLT